MLLDERTEFCDATALNTGAVASYLIGDVMDLGGGAPSAAGDGVNVGPDLYFVVQVDTAPTSTTASPNGVKLQFHLASDAQAAIAVDGTATYHYSSPVYEKAALPAGTYAVKVKLPDGAYERYLGVLQTTSVEAVLTGKVNAFLTPNAPAIKAFANDPGDTLKNS